MSFATRHPPFLPLLPLLLLALALSACAGKGASPGSAYSGPPAMDVLRLPQDLSVYAPAAGGSKALVDEAGQRAAAERQRQALFRPWTLDRPARWIKQSLDKNFHMRPEKAYSDNKLPFPDDEWQRLVANSNKAAFGKGAGPAITLRHTNLRAMPTSMRYYLRPDLPGEGYPFDYFQHTSLPPGTPLFICNVSADSLWLLVDSPVTAGWLPAVDVAGADEAFMERWQSRPLAAIVRDNISLGESRAHLGALLPLGEGGGLYLPVREHSGLAGMVEIFPSAADYAPVPMTLCADNVALLGNRMMGQAYTWGGLDEKRDCSALTRDLLAPFGLFLPRNSKAQAGRGRTLPLAGMTDSEKLAVIARGGAPFRSLLWLKGHIGLYLGVYEGKPLMFHNMWGLRTKDAKGGCDNRAVVGKAVVTTLQPGIERPDLCNRGSLLERMESMAILPE